MNPASGPPAPAVPEEEKKEEPEFASDELDRCDKRLEEVGGKKKGYRKRLRENYEKYRNEAEDALKGLFDDDITQMLAGSKPNYAV